MSDLKIFIKLLNKKADQARSNQSGFSLIEILIALTLIGIAGTFVAGKIFDQFREGKERAARIQMQNLEARLKDFKRKCGYYPTTEQGLEALVAKPTAGRECKNYPPEGFIDGGKVPADPWDEAYIYESDGKNYNIKSAGDDLEDGTEDDISLKDTGKSSESGSDNAAE